MTEIGGRPYWELTYDKDGRLLSPEQGQFIGELKAAGARHLFVFSHGWGNSQGIAKQLYESMFTLISAALDDAPNVQDAAYVPS